MTLPRRLELLVFACVFVACAYVYNGWGWNQTARYDAIWAFVEPGPNRGTVRIDDFLVDPEAGINTGDWARNPEHGPHYYANKAPGTTLLGIPFYALLYGAESALGADPRSPTAVHVNAYLLHLWVTVLPVALSAVFFLRLLVGLGLSRTRALGVTGVLYGGTLVLPFSTMMWGHTTAAAFVVMALACFTSARSHAWWWCGILAGLAVLTDYGAAPFAAALVVTASVVPAYRDRLARVVAGGAGPLLILLGYHELLFGSPFRLASSYSPGEMLTERYLLGLFGVPRLNALVGLLVSTARGVFVFMPVLAAAIVGVRHVRGHPHAPLGWLALACVVAALLSNASFNAWQGGVSAGPRYLIWSLPLWVVLVSFVPPTRRATAALLSLGAVSAANMFVIAAVSPMSPDALRGSPLFFAWAKLLGVLRTDLGLEVAPSPGGSLSRGSLHMYPIVLLRDWDMTLQHPLIERWGSFTLGERALGLRGTLSLLPGVAALAGLATAAFRTARRIDGSTP